MKESGKEAEFGSDNLVEIVVITSAKIILATSVITEIIVVNLVIELNKKVEEVTLKKDETVAAATEDLKDNAKEVKSRKYSRLSSSIILKSPRKWKRSRWKIRGTESWRRLGQSDVLDG